LNLLIKNITIISPKDNLNGLFDVLIKDGLIEKIGYIDDIRDIEILDGKGLTLIPGFFDMHVHFREPGQTEKEDIQSGTLAAANGGFTGVLCMPNTIPPIDNTKVIEFINKKSENNLVDVYLSGTASVDRKGMKTSDLNNLFESGVLAITDDGSPVNAESILNDVFAFSEKSMLPFLQHAENYTISGNGSIHKGEIAEKLSLEGIPSESETATVKNDLEILKNYPDAKYHIQHISCGETISLVEEAKSKNFKVSCEVCPHHFILTDEIILKEGTNAKMNPPLRTNKDVELIIKGLKDDIIDVICTDHAPHTKSEKDKNLETAPFGITGLETCISLTYTYLVDKEYLSFEKMIEKLSDNPRKILNLQRVKITEGEKANFTILNLDSEYKIDVNKFKSKSRNTPFNNFKVKCKPYAVINNSQIYYSDL